MIHTRGFRGHHAYYDRFNKCWRFVKNRQCIKDGQPLSCERCGCKPTPEGHDACLGTLPGIKAACCGHGVNKGCVVWKDGMITRFPSWNKRKVK